jgi:hypothetical protein
VGVIPETGYSHLQQYTFAARHNEIIAQRVS